jgi:hypothetical protein
MRETWEDRQPKAYTSFKSLAREQFFMRVKSETHRTTIKYKTHDLPDRSLGCRDGDGLDCVTTYPSGVYC